MKNNQSYTVHPADQLFNALREANLEKVRAVISEVSEADRGALFKVVNPTAKQNLFHVASEIGYAIVTDEITDVISDYFKKHPENQGTTVADLLNSPDKNKNTPLHLSIKNSYYKTTQKLLKNGANPHRQKPTLPILQIDENQIITIPFRTDRMLTPLESAVARNDGNIATLCIEHMGGLESHNHSENRPRLAEQLFYIATMHGHKKLALDYLNHCRPNVTIVDENGYTAMHRAAANGYTEVVESLIHHEKGINGNSSSFLDKNANPMQRTMLRDAAANNHPLMVALLLSAGADINKQDAYGRTPLHASSYRGNGDCVALLLANPNVDPDIRDKNILISPDGTEATEGLTALETTKIVKAKVEKEVNEKKYATHNLEQLSAVITLLEKYNRPSKEEEKKGQIEEKQNRRIPNPPKVSKSLIEAIDNCDIKAVRAFAKNKDIKEQLQQKLDGHNVLHLAARSGFVTMLDTLLALCKEHGVISLINETDSQGLTPLHYASSHHFFLASTSLVEAGANPLAGIHDHGLLRTPLAYAVESGNANIVQMLITRAKPMIDMGQLVRHAAIHSTPAVLATLAELDTELFFATDANGQNAFHKAALAGKAANMQYMLEVSNISPLRNPHASDKTGRTPLHYAALNNHVDVLDVLKTHGGEASINARDNTGRTPVYMAINKVMEEATTWLIQNNANLDYANKDHNKPINSLKDRMIKYRSSGESTSNEIYKAMLRIQKQVEDHMSVPRTPRKSMTPRSTPATPPSLPLATSPLLSLIAAPSQSSPYTTPSEQYSDIETTVLRGDVESIRTLKLENRDLFCHALYCSSKRPATALELLRLHDFVPLYVNPNASSLGRQPLHWTIDNPRMNEVSKEFIQRIVAHNAEQKADIEWKKTFGIPNTIKELNDLELQDKGGSTVLHYGALSGSKLVPFLLEHISKEGVAIQDEHDRTPLHLAATGQLIETMALLLDKNPDLVNMQDKDGNTALMLAFKRANLSDDHAMAITAYAVDMLLERGADPTIPTLKGETPLDAAIYYGLTDIVIKMLAHKTVQNQLKNGEINREILIQLANDKGHPEIAQTLKDNGPTLLSTGKRLCNAVANSCRHFCKNFGWDTVKSFLDPIKTGAASAGVYYTLKGTGSSTSDENNIIAHSCTLTSNVITTVTAIGDNYVKNKEQQKKWADLQRKKGLVAKPASVLSNTFIGTAASVMASITSAGLAYGADTQTVSKWFGGASGIGTAVDGILLKRYDRQMQAEQKDLDEPARYNTTIKGKPISPEEMDIRSMVRAIESERSLDWRGKAQKVMQGLEGKTGDIANSFYKMAKDYYNEFAEQKRADSKDDEKTFFKNLEDLKIAFRMQYEKHLSRKHSVTETPIPIGDSFREAVQHSRITVQNIRG